MSVFSAIMRDAVVSGILCATVAMSLAVAPASSSTKLRLSYLSPPDSDMDIWVKDFAQQVGAQTEERVTVRIYPASQLGDWEEVVEQLTQGSVDLAIQCMSTKLDRRPALTWFPYTAVDDASAREAWNTGDSLSTSLTNSSSLS